MRLGALEQAILLACLAHRDPYTQMRSGADLYRDELPGFLWGWPGRDRCLSRMRGGRREPQTYPGIDLKTYRCKQAALTRALATLYQKHLIDAGCTHEATGLKIYSQKRAAALAQEPSTPWTEAELRQWIQPAREYGGKRWNRKGAGVKPRESRNMKAIRLTVEGEAVTAQLQVKSQNRYCDLTPRE